MFSQRPRVLAVGHGAAATGFSRVLDTLAEHLSPRFDIHHFATNHYCDRVTANRPIYGNPDPRDIHGTDRLEELVAILRPSIVLFLGDLWFCCIHAGRLKSKEDCPRLIAYCPVDGHLTRPDLYSGLRQFDHIVAYNEFGRSQLRRVLANLNEDAQTPISTIFHGVDTSRFSADDCNNLTDRKKAQLKLNGETGFIVLNANKHDHRKRLDLTIEGFARFARGKPSDVKLYLHTGATFAGPDLRGIAAAAGVSERLLTTDGWLDGHPAVSEERLTLIYQAADVGINTSGGEAWGLVSFEHAATGAPQIVPDHSGCGPLWSNVGTRLPAPHTGEHFGLGMMRSFVEPDDIAAMLDRLYSDLAFRREQAELAYATARDPRYNWKNIACDWDQILTKVLTT